MRYQIPSEAPTGGHPKLAIDPIIIAWVAVIAGSLPGFIWLGLNAYFLGCRDLARQIRFLVIGFIVMKLFSMLRHAFPLFDGYRALAEDTQNLFIELASNAAFACLMAVLILGWSPQSDVHKLVSKQRKATVTPYLVAAVVILASDFVRSHMADAPILRTLWGGVTLGIF